MSSSWAIWEIWELQDKLWLPSSPSNTWNCMLRQHIRVCVQFVMNMGIIWVRAHAFYRPQQTKSKQRFFRAGTKCQARDKGAGASPSVFTGTWCFQLLLPLLWTPSSSLSVIVTLSEWLLSCYPCATAPAKTARTWSVKEAEQQHARIEVLGLCVCKKKGYFCNRGQGTN